MKSIVIVLCAFLPAWGCGNGDIVSNGVAIPSQDEYLSSMRGCNFFFDANFIMERDGNIVTLTVPATQATVQGELQPDNTFSFQVEDSESNLADCVAEFTLGEDLNFECIHSGGTCSCSYSRNNDN